MDQSLSLIKDLLISISAGIGTIIAIIGLGTWKKQIGANVEYEAARKLLKSTFKIRDAIAWVRNPFISTGEMVDEPGAQQQSSDQRKNGLHNAYNRRWQKVIDANSELSTNLLEAEVLWGKSIRTEYNKLFSTIAELSSTIYIYFSHLDEPEAKLFNDKHRNILYASNDDKDDFKNGLENRLEEIEKLLMPYLNRK